MLLRHIKINGLCVFIEYLSQKHVLPYASKDKKEGSTKQ
jgi:hypothetical protein